MPGRYEFSLPERRQRDGWTRIGNFDLTTTAIMVLAGVASMFVYAANPAWFERLIFFTPEVRQGEVWRLVTWPIANPPTRVLVVLTLIFFWFIGHQIEEAIGRRPFTAVIAAATFVPPAVLTALGGSPTLFAYMFGLSYLGSGLFALFALDRPNTPFFFGIPAWVLAAVMIGIDMLRLLGERYWGGLLFLLLVIATCIVGGRQYGLAEGTAGFIPNLRGNRRTARPAAKRQRKSKGRSGGGKVVAGPWGETGFTPQHDPADQAELDQLLDKISAGGMDSLSKTDKARLNELSKKLRGR